MKREQITFTAERLSNYYLNKVIKVSVNSNESSTVGPLYLKVVQPWIKLTMDRNILLKCGCTENLQTFILLTLRNIES